jgi:hypothetical protein
MTDAPTNRDPLPRIGQRSGADPFPARTADPVFEAAHNAVRRRLPEIVSAGVPEATGLDVLFKRDREDLASKATAFLTRSTHDREAASAVLAASTAALRDRLALTTADGSVRSFLVDTADGIFTGGGGQLSLVEIHTGPTPENNFARFTLDDEHHRRGFAVGTDSVTFDFTWRNESQRTVSVDVHGYLVLDGTAVTLCDGGWIAFNSSTMDLVPTMALFDLSTNPPTELPTQDSDSTVALHLSCETSGFIEPGGIDGRDIFRGYDLQHTGAVVPAGGQLRVQLSLVFSFSIVGDGEVQASFATAPRRVLTPGVLFVATDM